MPSFVTSNTTEIFVPTDMTGSYDMSSTMIFNYTYLIGDDSTIINDEFAMSGLYVEFQYSSSTDPTVSLIVSEYDLSFNVSQDFYQTDFVG